MLSPPGTPSARDRARRAIAVRTCKRTLITVAATIIAVRCVLHVRSGSAPPKPTVRGLRAPAPVRARLVTELVPPSVTPPPPPPPPPPPKKKYPSPCSTTSTRRQRTERPACRAKRGTRRASPKRTATGSGDRRENGAARRAGARQKPVAASAPVSRPNSLLRSSMSSSKVSETHRCGRLSPVSTSPRLAHRWLSPPSCSAAQSLARSACTSDTRR